MNIKNKTGKIIPNGVSLEKHENDIVVFFTNHGKTIELIPPSNTPGAKTPDILMDGIYWEMKSSIGGSLKTLEHTIDRATKQSENIIVDIRLSKIPKDKIEAYLMRLFKSRRSIQRMIVIKDDGEPLIFS